MKRGEGMYGAIINSRKYRSVTVKYQWTLQSTLSYLLVFDYVQMLNLICKPLNGNQTQECWRPEVSENHHWVWSKCQNKIAEKDFISLDLEMKLKINEHFLGTLSLLEY